MATQTNLLVYFDKIIARKRKSQSDITSYFKKADQNQKHDGDVVSKWEVCACICLFITLGKHFLTVKVM